VPSTTAANGTSKDAKIKIAMETSTADSGVNMQAGAR